ncbi:MAG: radical SAM protein [Vulcanimicrobiota bacterium]
MNYRELSKKQRFSMQESRRTKSFEPSYLTLTDAGFIAKEKKARAVIAHCSLCPRRCGADRLHGEQGFCRQEEMARVAKALPHFGEEPPLSGTRGAGTVFFSGCTLRCIFCQNWQISQHDLGDIIDAEELAGLFLELQAKGCHNVELVSPTPHITSIITALRIASGKGLNLPLVYNTNGFLSAETLDLLNGLIDIYLPDMKYSSSSVSEELSACSTYVEMNRASLHEMVRQCGNRLIIDENGIARRGILIRLLLLPEGLEGAEESLAYTARAIGQDIPVSLMSQYSPLYKAAAHSALQGNLSPARRREVVKYALRCGIREIWNQKDEAAPLFIPDFLQQNPFGDMNRAEPPKAIETEKR